jgi:hypothetical protein
MAIVWPTALGVEQYAAAGREVEVPRLGCPACKEPMSYWGWYGRDVRAGRSQVLWVRRLRCRGCQVSHAVLPSFVAHGRLDAIGVIGPALEAMVAGGARVAADALGLPYTTVRDWRRRFGSRAEMLAIGAVRACVALGAPAPRLAGTAVAVVLGALRSAWRAAWRRLGPGVGNLWRVANALVGGHLLTTNMDPPWSSV